MTTTAQDPPHEQLNALIGAFNAGQFAEVVAQAGALIQQHPGSFTLWSLVGAGSLHIGQIDQAVMAFGRACAINPALPEAHCNLGNAQRALSRADLAVSSYRAALACNPDFVGAYFELGNALAELGHLPDAAAAFGRAVAIAPDFAAAHSRLGEVYHAQGQLDEAATCWRHALAIEPDDAAMQYNLGVVLKALGKTDQAIACFYQAVALAPDFADAHNNLGVALEELGQTDQAIAAYQDALAINPEFAGAYNNLGKALYGRAQLEAAAQSYARALQIEPGFTLAHFNLGVVLFDQGCFEQAAASYRRALAIQPDYADAHNNLGEALREQGLLAEAVASYHRAVSCKPDHAGAYNNLGSVLSALGQLDEAVTSYRRALTLDPANADTAAHLLHQRLHMGDWHDYDSHAATVARLVEQVTAPPPFTMLPMADDPALQLQFSRKWATARFTHAALPVPARPEQRPDRLRIGYFSADFYDHATLFLMAGLLREHDAAQFEVHAFSHGHIASGEWRNRAKNDVAGFHDISGLPTAAIVDLVRSHALDIAIDLKGYTARARLDLFQHRLAPVQISYLGYPGSLGTDFIDYIVADPVVIPADQRAHYSENIIWLPHSYQPNDNARAIARIPSTRADFGLPDDGIVFCCFNNSYKISPHEFDIWMRVLRQIDGSVLWLFKSNRWCEANLRNAAIARGIAPERLIFAEPTDHTHHLARQQHADLFLDTFHYNAHTTASDALWAGLPVVTKAGRQFAARVAASLLTAVGLPELITHSDADYEALILALATDPARLAGIKARLASNRHDHPLFDTVCYTRQFETGLRRAYDAYFDGQAPQDIHIA